MGIRHAHKNTVATSAAICHLGPRPSLPWGRLGSLRNSCALCVTAASLGGRWGGVLSPGFLGKPAREWGHWERSGWGHSPRQRNKTPSLGKLAGSQRTIWELGVAVGGAPSPQSPCSQALECEGASVPSVRPWGAQIEARAPLPNRASSIGGAGGHCRESPGTREFCFGLGDVQTLQEREMGTALRVSARISPVP